MTQNKRATGGDDWFTYQARKSVPKVTRPVQRLPQFDKTQPIRVQPGLEVEESNLSESMIQRIFNRRR